MSIARLCREARTDLDITQRDLASAVGVSRAYIASIETGRPTRLLRSSSASLMRWGSSYPLWVAAGS